MTINPNLVEQALTSVLKQSMMHYHNKNKQFPVIPVSTKAKRNLLGDILIESGNHWKEDTLKLLDRIWTQENITSRRNTTLLQDIPAINTINILYIY